MKRLLDILLILNNAHPKKFRIVKDLRKANRRRDGTMPAMKICDYLGSQCKIVTYADISNHVYGHRRAAGAVGRYIAALRDKIKHGKLVVTS